VTIAELLALLGRAWARLLLYPGGLAAFAALWAAGLLVRRSAGGEGAGERPASAGGVARWQGVLGLAAPWLALALLPLPYAAAFGRPVDMVVIVALLECPRLLVAARDLRAEELAARGVRRLAAALNGYPPLLGAALVLAQSVGSLELGAIAAGPDEAAPQLAWALYLIGAAALLLALPPLLELGPFAVGGPGAPLPGGDLLAIGLRLRSLGFVLLAALPLLGLLPAASEDGSPAIWLVPLPPLLVAALAWAFGRLTAGRRPRPWAQGYLVLSAALIGVLAYAASVDLRARLS